MMAVQNFSGGLSGRHEIKVDGEHGFTCESWIEHPPRDGDYVRVSQCFSLIFAVRGGDEYSVMSVPEPARIQKIASKPGPYCATEQPRSSYDFRDKIWCHAGFANGTGRVIERWSGEQGIKFYDRDPDQSGVHIAFAMTLWGRIVAGEIGGRMTNPNRSQQVGKAAPWPKGQRRNDTREWKPLLKELQAVRYRGIRRDLAAKCKVHVQTVSH